MNPIYFTGINPDGKWLKGGVWTLWAQEGFPIEMSYLFSKDCDGVVVDWAEAMIDASRTDNCPALMAEIQNFLPAETIQDLKIRFVGMVQSGKSFDELYAEKKEAGRKFDASIKNASKVLEVANAHFRANKS